MSVHSRRRLIDRTIWSPNLLQEVPPRFRTIYTVLLPFKYTVLFVFGILSSLSRVDGAIARLTTGAYSDLWPPALATASLLALLGLAFRRWVLELWATSFVLALLLVYPIALAASAIASRELRTGALAIGLLVLLASPAWRVADIVRTERRRRP